MSVQAICRNCGNTGVTWPNGDFCRCAAGRAAAQVLGKERVKAMEWREYQQQAMRTRGDTTGMGQRERLTLAGLGLAGEAGEIVDHLKKIAFHGHTVDHVALAREIGDLMWYVAYLLDVLGVRMDDVLFENIVKLKARYPMASVRSAAATVI